MEKKKHTFSLNELEKNEEEKKNSHFYTNVCEDDQA